MRRVSAPIRHYCLQNRADTFTRKRINYSLHTCNVRRVIPFVARDTSVSRRRSDGCARVPNRSESGAHVFAGNENNRYPHRYIGRIRNEKTEHCRKRFRISATERGNRRTKIASLVCAKTAPRNLCTFFVRFVSHDYRRRLGTCCKRAETFLLFRQKRFPAATIAAVVKSTRF